MRWGPLGWAGAEYNSLLPCLMLCWCVCTPHKCSMVAHMSDAARSLLLSAPCGPHCSQPLAAGAAGGARSARDQPARGAGSAAGACRLLHSCCGARGGAGGQLTSLCLLPPPVGVLLVFALCICSVALGGSSTGISLAGTPCLEAYKTCYKLSCCLTGGKGEQNEFKTKGRRRCVSKGRGRAGRGGASCIWGRQK